jgi:opacity protein-like surface antigen
MLNQGIYGDPNDDVNFNRDVFKIQGDFKVGYSGHALLGHQYTAESSFILKFAYNYTPVLEAELTDSEAQYYSDPLIGSWVASDVTGERTFKFHSIIIGMRHEFNPGESFHSYVDYGVGFVTASYEIVGIYDEDTVFEDRRVQTGFAVNFAYGLVLELTETLDFYGRADLTLAKIPDSRNQYNEGTGNGPWVNPLTLNIGVRKYFTAIF